MPLLDDIAAASAECGMQVIGRWVPVERHAVLRTALHDLAIGSLRALADSRIWRRLKPASEADGLDDYRKVVSDMNDPKDDEG